ncbi:MAG TPA: class 1 fructose-bisphosphatase, partial [Verrucomicrobiae bacterium]|nr:class 1 fructose-bisphosphatase [Verrucomicrobiae bacterium]
VHEFTLDPASGEFLLSNDRLTLPDKCSYYSINSAYEPHISERDQKYVSRLQAVAKQRWIGAFVADFHRNLLKGGVFFFPPVDSSGKGEYKPKLRLNYEVKPMAYLIDQAGGTAITTDQEDILTLQPESLHQRVPIIIGNKQEVNVYKEVS